MWILKWSKTWLAETEITILFTLHWFSPKLPDMISHLLLGILNTIIKDSSGLIPLMPGNEILSIVNLPLIIKKTIESQPISEKKEDGKFLLSHHFSIRRNILFPIIRKWLFLFLKLLPIFVFKLRKTNIYLAQFSKV